MSAFRVIAFLGLIGLFLGVVALGNAMAGEKFKFRTVKHFVKFETINVGDEEGHIIAVSEAKGLVSNKEGKWFGDGWPHHFVALFDINPKIGVVVGHGYEYVTDPDGDRYYYSWEGKAVRENYWEGTYTMLKGTGKFEGIKGNGSWTCVVLPGQPPELFYADEEWDIELPRR